MITCIVCGENTSFYSLYTQKHLIHDMEDYIKYGDEEFIPMIKSIIHHAKMFNMKSAGIEKLLKKKGEKSLEAVQEYFTLKKIHYRLTATPQERMNFRKSACSC